MKQSHTVKAFFDDETFTLTYVIFSDLSKDAIVIDPVWNYDKESSKLSYDSLNDVLSFVEDKKLNVHYILDTHAHADHISGALELKKKLPQAKIGIGKAITKVQSEFKDILKLEELNTQGEQFDILLEDGNFLSAGELELKVISTPGHTPSCSSYLVDGISLFTGDSLFMPDSGTGRCDFPLGSAKDLYESIHEKIYKLSDEVIFYTGHDYQPNGRELSYQSTIGESKKNNIQLKEETTEAEFVMFREQRDKTLSEPKLLIESLTVNIGAGKLPETKRDDVSYIKDCEF